MEVSAAERHGLLLARLLALTRASALCLAVASLVMHWDATRVPTVVAALLFLVVADNIFVCFRLRHGDFSALAGDAGCLPGDDGATRRRRAA